MIEIYLLEQLDAFARCGTVSEASKRLHLSQPAVTRSMKKLEDDLGVCLFTRTKNRLYLNETGKLAAKYAAEILEKNREMESEVRAFDKSLHTVRISSCAPVPLYVLTPLLQQIFSGMTITSAVLSDAALERDFRDGICQLAVVHDAPADPDLFFVPCGHETLRMAIPPDHPLAARKSIRFSDLSDVPILQLTEVGFWADLVRQRIPRPKLLLQKDQSTFNEIMSLSSLPTFSSDYFEEEAQQDPSRRIIPIDEPDASVSYYLVCRKKDQEYFRPLFSSLPDWCRG